MLSNAVLEAPPSWYNEAPVNSVCFGKTIINRIFFITIKHT